MMANVYICKRTNSEIVYVNGTVYAEVTGLVKMADSSGFARFIASIGSEGVVDKRVEPTKLIRSHGDSVLVVANFPDVPDVSTLTATLSESYSNEYAGIIANVLLSGYEFYMGDDAGTVFELRF